MKHLLLISALIVTGCASVLAQPAPIVATTLRTTDTGGASLRVGCTLSGPCTGGIVAGNLDTGLITSGGAIGIANSVPGVTTMKLYNNAGTLTWNGIALATGASLSGTAGKLAKFTAANAVGDSICSEAGTTITCVNTISATTLTGTLATALQPNVTTLAGLTTAGALVTVGTITTGTWNATKIGLLYGGTNLDLTATGGAGQFLKQNSLGGAITVTRPAVADLSDAASVALLNTPNTLTGAGTQTLSLREATAGVANYSALFLGNDTSASNVYLQSFSSTFTPTSLNLANGGTVGVEGAGGLSIVTASASNGIRFYSGGSALQRWGINAAGDLTIGAAGNISDSVGTPTLASCGTSPFIAAGGARDSAFIMTTGSTNTVNCTINFGHTFASIPICAFTPAIGAPPATVTFGSGSSITIGYASNSSQTYYVLCLGR